MQFEYIERNRDGDHIRYISDLAKMRSHGPSWNFAEILHGIFVETYEANRAR
jgi:CDP-paratose 2-epimerase